MYMTADGTWMADEPWEAMVSYRWDKTLVVRSASCLQRRDMITKHQVTLHLIRHATVIPNYLPNRYPPLCAPLPTAGWCLCVASRGPLPSPATSSCCLCMACKVSCCALPFAAKKS